MGRNVRRLLSRNLSPERLQEYSLHVGNPLRGVKFDEERKFHMSRSPSTLPSIHHILTRELKGGIEWRETQVLDKIFIPVFLFI